jgi:hypothetical protein
VVVRQIGAKHASRMALVEDDDMVQTLSTDRPDHMLDVGVLPRRARWGAEGREAERFDGAAERRIEGRSPSWRRNRAVAFSEKVSRSCWRAHAEVGWRVTLRFAFSVADLTSDAHESIINSSCQERRSISTRRFCAISNGGRSKKANRLAA